MIISCIVAAAEDDAIGRAGGEIPWRLKSDFDHFKKTTSGHPVIMGRKTLPSIGNKPLPNRTNIVLTRDTTWTVEGFVSARNIDTALELASDAPGGDEVFICGGGEVYAATMPLVDRLYLTRVHTTVPDADAFFRFDPSGWNLDSAETHASGVDTQDQFDFTIEVWSRGDRATT
jgi:dihydrofolate reductase